MKKIPLMISALFLMATTTVNAHGPVRQKIEESITINAPATKVWAIIKNYNDMSWLPAIAKTQAEGGNEVGATRVLTLKVGGTITEELKAYKANKMSYKYKITDISTLKTIQHSGQEEIVPVLPVNNYSAAISVKVKDDKSEVIWKAAFYRGYMNNNPPVELNKETARAAVTKILKAGLENIKALAENNNP